MHPKTKIRDDASFGKDEVFILAMRQTKEFWFIDGTVDAICSTSNVLFCLVFSCDFGFGGGSPLTFLAQYTFPEWPRLSQFLMRWFEYLWEGLYRPSLRTPVLHETRTELIDLNEKRISLARSSSAPLKKIDYSSGQTYKSFCRSWKFL